MIIHVHNGNGHVRVTPSTFSLYLGPVYTFIHRRAPPSTHIMSDFFFTKVHGNIGYRISKIFVGKKVLFAVWIWKKEATKSSPLAVVGAAALLQRFFCLGR